LRIATVIAGGESMEVHGQLRHQRRVPRALHLDTISRFWMA
jgi:hypothetical protein